MKTFQLDNTWVVANDEVSDYLVETLAMLQKTIEQYHTLKRHKVRFSECENKLCKKARVLLERAAE